ncbi:soluble lamin-associated protein of 75 kDa-like [Carassius carassius]|uniref:soluble lamin-associated protein of 75 kDa-like n=1 Tax=Carassius carassius TaxID=217509 RepID=UPI00286872B1|nr:soluble lamin-associated protein of 75 kDa-like [Carassius carassius]XP_059398548.1 soluble lamin-associated protein of 75 kDa-like [Carassius carassius]
MDFPVDVLVSCRLEDLEGPAQSYMNKLLYSNPDNTQYFTLPSMRKIQISPASVGFVPLYGANLKHKVLALFAPEDQFTAVALFLAGQWYTVEDILRTSNPAREGLVKVRSVGERTVLYVLNRIIYRTMEMGSNEVPFLCHGEDVFAKILWKNGEAVGFYSVKSKGSLCNSFVSQCYLLPVMDSIFVRKDHRGNGHGLQILEDFVDSFTDDELGVKYPLTPAMQRVCRKYLSTYPADVDLLWEVEGVGGVYQKVKVANKLGSMTLQCNHSSWAAEVSKNGKVAVNEVEMTEESYLDITEDVVVVNKHLKVAEMSELPISTRTRSTECRQKKRQREEPEESTVENRPEKISRVIEPDAEIEPDAVVPETKEHVDGETGGEQEGAATSAQVEEAATNEAPADTEILVAEVNEEIGVSHKEENEKSAVTAEDAQIMQELPLEADPVIQNGPAEEIEAEREAQDDIIGTPEVSEVVEQIDQELVTEEKQEVSPPVEEEEEVQQDQEEEVAPAVEDVASAVEETEDTDHSQAVPEAPVIPANQVECVSSVQDSDTVEGPPAPELEAPHEETSPSAAVEEDVIIETEEPAVNQQDETASDETLETEESPPAVEHSEKEEPDVNNLPQTDEKNKQKKEEDTATTEDDDDEGKSSDEIQDSPPGVRILRGGRIKPVLPTPKHTSRRLSKAVVIQVFDEEENFTSTEEEKWSTEEDEAAEHNSGEEEDPPVIDRRVLRRKTKVIQSTPTKAQRRSKK